MTAISDPIGNGLVASFARPGGNTTGVTLFSNELAGKRLEMLNQLVPQLKRVAILAERDRAIGGTADIDRPPAPIASDENDPSRFFSLTICCAAQH